MGGGGGGDARGGGDLFLCCWFVPSGFFDDLALAALCICFFLCADNFPMVLKCLEHCSGVNRCVWGTVNNVQASEHVSTRERFQGH